MQISDIDISLSHGQLLRKKQRIVLIFSLIGLSLLPILTIVMLFFPITWDIPIIFVLIVANVMVLLILIVPIYIIVKDRKTKKRIKLWLDDAVETKAYSLKTGENKSLFLPTGITIQVKFAIENKKYVKDSAIKVFGGDKGYLTTFKKYADREIRILYSPKYDEVLILKDNAK